ncbi:MAG: PA14 domain-containing protein, partial [Lentisphaeraceae bacterium]|nr:PA14 domain-containing protein [Lentisphaeraceae bacterium]
TGKFIFNGAIDDIIDKHLDDKPNPLSTYKPTINPKLDDLILKLLSKKPENRYQDAESLENDLLEIQGNFKKAKKAASSGSTPSNKKGLSDIAQRDSKFQKKPLIVAICVLSLFLLASMITLAVVYNSKPKAQAENHSITKNESVKEVFISEAELDEKNAPMHPDFIPKSEVATDLKKGLNYKYFEKWEMSSFDQLKALKPITQGKVLLLNLDFKKRSKYFAFEFSGYLGIPHTNTYELTLSADDSCQIFIGNKEVLSVKYASQKPLTAICILEKGLHPVKIRYLQKEGTTVLKLEVESPRLKKQALPHSWFLREEL